MGSLINRLGNQLQAAWIRWKTAKSMVADRAQEQNLKKVTLGDIVQQYRKIKQMVASGSEEWKTICLDRYRKNGVSQIEKWQPISHKEQSIEIHKQVETYRAALKDVQATADSKWKDLTVYRQCFDSLSSSLKALEATRSYAVTKGMSKKDLQSIDQKCAELAEKIKRHQELCGAITDDYFAITSNIGALLKTPPPKMDENDRAKVNNVFLVGVDSINSKITELLNENVLEDLQSDLREVQGGFISCLNKPQVVLEQYQKNIEESLEGIQKDCIGCQAEGEFLSSAKEYLEGHGAALVDHFGDYVLEHAVQGGDAKNNDPVEYANAGEALNAWIEACEKGVQEASESNMKRKEYETLSSSYEAFQSAVTQMTDALARGTENFETRENQLNDALGKLKELVNANPSDPAADDPQEIVERFSTMLQKQREAAKKAHEDIVKHIQVAMHVDVYNFLADEYARS